MNFTRPIAIGLLILFLALFGLHHYNSKKPGFVRRSQIVMGTVVEITALGSDAAHLHAAIEKSFDEMRRIENLMTVHGEKSDVVRLSQPRTTVNVSPETAEVISLGLKVVEASNGAFEMGMGHLKALWGIETDHPRIPEAEEIHRALASIGKNTLKMEGTVITKKKPALAFDLGGIAKGFAIDRAISVLQNAGIKNASVNAGGDIRLLGDRKGRPWRIGIKHPRQKEKLLATISLQDLAIVTSGDYERFFEENGVRYHHLFDPHTGFPARKSQSATVIAPTAALADALATAAFVLGPKHGLDLLKSFPEVEGIIVGSDGVPVLTAGMKENVEWF